MFYVMYIFSENKMADIKAFFQTSLPDSEVGSESDSELVLCDDSFTLKVTTTGNNILFASEDYKCEFNYCLWFELILDGNQWASKLMILTDKLLGQISKNLVLESNGEKPVVLQDSRGLFIDSNLGGEEPLPFDLISFACEERELIRE